MYFGRMIPGPLSYLPLLLLMPPFPTSHPPTPMSFYRMCYAIPRRQRFSLPTPLQRCFLAPRGSDVGFCFRDEHPEITYSQCFDQV